MWTFVLRLYLAAYCRPTVYKDIWNHAVGVQQAGGTSYMSSEVATAFSNAAQTPPLDSLMRPPITSRSRREYRPLLRCIRSRSPPWWTC